MAVRAGPYRSTLPAVKSGEPGDPSADLPDGPERSDAPGRRRFSRRSKITAVVIALVVIWVTAAVIDLVVAAGHIRHGEAAVQSARQGLSADGILSGAPVGSLRSAQSNFSSAHGLLSSPLLWPVEVLPVVGRQLRSVQDLSGAAEQVAQVGIGAVGRSHALLRLPHTAGPDRVAALQQLAALAASTHSALAGVNLGPDQALISPLAREHNTFLSDLTQIRTTLARTSEGASAAATILQGPKTYLLLAGNNAEMRSGSGAFEEAGTITTGNGELHLSDMTPTSSLTLPAGTVPVGGDLEARWGWLLPGTDFRNLGLTPQFDVNGPLAASMWKASTGQSVDGVLAIDVGGLQDLLEVTGPVTTASGQVVSASNVTQILLHDQYVGETYTSDSTTRTDELAALASATLHALENRPFQLHTMADALSSAAEGRHVLLWSADTTTEAAWAGAGVAGQLQPSSLMADIINRGGNKLDQYLTENVSLKLRTQGTKTAGTLTMTFSNKTPPGQSPFIAGPFPGLGTQYGEYVGIATVNLPGYASDITTPSNSSVVASGAEGPTILEGATLDILQGATQSMTFNFVLPEAHGSMTVVPSARIGPANWHVVDAAGGSTFQDVQPQTINW
jgi:Protein of unknown function (DUF4012)